MISELYKPFLKNFGVSEQFDPKSNISYLIKKVGQNHKCMIIFFTGIGLDYTDFYIPFTLSSSHNILVAPTVPGFEEGYSASTLSIPEQAKKLSFFIKTLCAEHEIFKLKIYGFSFGSDIIIDLLDQLVQFHKIGKPKIERIYLTEVNVDEKSCFITNKIKLSEHIDNQLKHTSFFHNILQAFENGELNKYALSDLSIYYSKIINKSWDQLIRSSKEITENPEGRLMSLIQKMKDNPDIPFSLVFSELRDRLSFETTIKKLDEFRRIKNLKIFSVEGRHFSHVDPEGIYRNLELM